MRLAILTIILFSSVFDAVSQLDMDSLLYCRGKSFQNYILIKDTMTRRTWINMRNYSKSLEEVAKIDDIIIDSVLPDLRGRLWIADEKVISLQQQLTQKEQSLEKSETEVKNLHLLYDFLFFIGGTVCLLFLTFLIIAIIYISKFRRRKKMISEKDNHIAGLNKQIADQNDIIRKLETEAQHVSNQIGKLSESNQLLITEKEALENELRELQSAFEKEVYIRKEIEAELKQLLKIVNDKQ
jgi:Na+-transporting methylmalonyl-CoA/oxaloacetate decarboxylase gamma subunit